MRHAPQLQPPAPRDRLLLAPARTRSLDTLRTAFVKYAGPDQQMDRNEFELFASRQNFEDRAAALWDLMDMDRNGIVTGAEFSAALEMLLAARAWLRFCPTCAYDHRCAFCRYVETCPNCNNERFCHEHWGKHPARAQKKASAGLLGVTLPVELPQGLPQGLPGLDGEGDVIPEEEEYAIGAAVGRQDEGALHRKEAERTRKLTLQQAWAEEDRNYKLQREIGEPADLLYKLRVIRA